MPNPITIARRPTSAPTSKPTLSKTDADVIAFARAELVRTDAMIDEILLLKDRLADFGRDYATGKISILEAAALLPATSATARAEITSGLRHAVKVHQREILEGVAGVITKARQHAVDELLDKCRDLESTERESARNIGIIEDGYQPSLLLERLREQHRRALDSLTHRITRQDITALP